MLSERQLEVVLAVVYDYIQTGEPVGSRTLSKKYLTGRSAATIRNEMSDLEELGYLVQPHTSAGRIPTSRAYRLYVDTILQRRRVPHPEAERWIAELREQRRDVEGALAYISQLLTRVTQYVSVAALAPFQEIRLLRVDFLRMDSTHALAIVVVEGGLVHHKMISFPCEVRQEELETLSRRINTVMAGRTWNEARNDLLQYVMNELREKEENCRAAISEMDGLLSAQPFRFYRGGAHHLLAMPDFKDLGKLHAVFSLLEEESALVELVDNCALNGTLTVTIGEENPEERMHDCSVVLATANTGGRKAILGLIGPVRMNYESSIAVLETVLEGLRDDDGSEEEQRHVY